MKKWTSDQMDEHTRIERKNKTNNRMNEQTNERTNERPVPSQAGVDTTSSSLVVSTPAWDGTGCEYDSWQCQIYIPCSLSLRLVRSLRGSLGTYSLTQKVC